MKLSSEQVEHIADLAHLELSPEEKELFQRQLSSILEYVDTLAKVNTADVEPLSHAVALENVTRPDEVRAGDEAARQRLIAEFPDKEGDLLKVPAVFS